MVNIVKSNSDKLEKMCKEDSRLVKGVFICHEPKGGSVKFPYRKYKQEPRKDYYLEDGKEYELPIGVVKHLNGCGWEIHSNLLDAQGNPYVGVGKKERRFTFQSSDFI